MGGINKVAGCDLFGMNAIEHDTGAALLDQRVAVCQAANLRFDSSCVLKLDFVPSGVKVGDCCFGVLPNRKGIGPTAPAHLLRAGSRNQYIAVGATLKGIGAV